MDEENIIYIPEADHQHLESQETEQEFVEEENFMAYIDKFDQSGQDLLKCEQDIQKIEEILEDIRTREQEIIQRNKKILEDIRTPEEERIQEKEKIREDIWTPEEERIQEKEKILEDIRTLEHGIQKRENKLDQMYQDLLTREQKRIEMIQKIQIREDFWKLRQERIQKKEKIREDNRKHRQERIQRREKILEDIRTPGEERIQEKEKILEDIRTPMQEKLQKSKDKTTKTTKSRHSTITSLLLGCVFFASRFCYVGFIPVESNLSLCKTDLSKLTDTCGHDEGKAIYCDLNVEGELGIGSFSKIWVQQDLLSRNVQYLRTPMQERFQKSKDNTTKTTKSRNSTITYSLLGSVSSRFGSVGAEFIPVESVLSLCKTDMSKLTDTCGHDEGKAIHCVLNDEGELGIGCFLKTWVKQGHCPYFRKSFGVLDIRLCLGNSSNCPTDRDEYLSNEVYKYPGCLINKSTRVLDILTNQTTESTTIRSSDAGDKETMLLIFVVILGLITFSLLLIHGLRFLRSMKIISRGLRSAYVPASMGHQDHHDLPDDGVDV